MSLHANAADFMPGIELCRRYFEQAVRPIIDKYFPGLRYDAAQLDAGSDTLGFDTPESMDHHWGPRLQLFLTEVDHARVAQQISKVLAAELPAHFMGFPTSFRASGENGVMVFDTDCAAGNVKHWVRIETVRSFFAARWNIGVNPDEPIEEVSWFGFCSTTLRRLTTGPVYWSGLGELLRVREQLAFYPDPVWRCQMLGAWNSIARMEECPSRCGRLGDEIGSQLACFKIVELFMELCFLIERQYEPYAKWLTKAFLQLNCGPVLMPLIAAALNASNWKEREAAICSLYCGVAAMHNALGITDPVAVAPVPYNNRNFMVCGADRVVQALVAPRRTA